MRRLDCQGPCLVKAERIRFTNSFEVEAALYEASLPGGCCEGCRDGRFRSKDRRAGAGHNKEHGEGPDKLSREKERACDRERAEAGEPAGERVGPPLGRSAVCKRILDEAEHPSEICLLAHPLGPYDKHALPDDRARVDRVSRLTKLRFRTPGDVGLVDGGLAFGYRAVDGDPLSRVDDDHIPRPDPFGRDLDLGPVLQDIGRLRRHLNRLPDGPARPVGHVVLEEHAQLRDPDDL